MSDTVKEVFGEAISSYSRAQAIEDGVLVNLESVEVCKEHYKWPVAMTRSVFDIVDRAVRNKKCCNDYNGVIHDILWMSRTYKRRLDESTVIFRVKITGAGKRSVYDFKLVVGPGDNAEPVITIMMPDED